MGWLDIDGDGMIQAMSVWFLGSKKKGRKSGDRAAGQSLLPLRSLLPFLFVFDSPFPFSVHDQVGVVAWQRSVLLHLMRSGWWGMDVVAV